MVMATATGETTRYSYDANGSLASILHPNGILDERSYDAAGRITTITGTASHGRLFYSRSYTYDAVGNPTSLKATDAKEHSSFSSWWKKAWWKKDGALTKWRETYSYDAQDRLTKACMNASCSRYFKYAYDSVGNRTSLKAKEGTTLYSYDAADELASTSDGHNKVTNYAYDQNGNETQEGSTRYAYNLENELTQVTDEGKNASYTYTGDGLIATRSTRSETTSYSWDTSSDLSELALETDSRGAGKSQVKDTRAYTYGAGPLGIVTQRESYTFHTDSLGSVIQLSDSRGKLVESYRYSPYGEDYGPGFSGEAQDEELNPIRFTGQYFDSASDLYNMRAREYELETGRFLEVDPLEADAGDPYLGVYVYADDQPTVKTDPSGERAMGGFGFFGADYQVNIVPTGAYSGYSYWSTLEPVIGWVGILPPFIRYQPYYNIASAYSGWASAYNVLNSSIKTHRITQRNALKRISVIKRALSAYGTKYVFGGGSSQGPTRGGGGEYPNYARNHVGFDCSGLMMYAYAGIRSLPHYSGNKGGWGDYTEGTATTYTKALPADLVFYHGWSDPQHVAMYLGGGKIVEAPQTWIKVPRYDNNGPNGWTTGTPDYVRISSVFEHGTPVGFRKLL